MEYDIEAILDMYEDDYTPDPRSTVPGPRPMYAQGQLVQNTIDGSRPGYGGTPGSIYKDGNGFMVAFGGDSKSDNFVREYFGGKKHGSLSSAKKAAEEFKTETGKTWKAQPSGPKTGKQAAAEKAIQGLLDEGTEVSTLNVKDKLSKKLQKDFSSNKSYFIKAKKKFPDLDFKRKDNWFIKAPKDIAKVKRLIEDGLPLKEIQAKGFDVGFIKRVASTSELKIAETSYDYYENVKKLTKDITKLGNNKIIKESFENGTLSKDILNRVGKITKSNDPFYDSRVLFKLAEYYDGSLEKWYKPKLEVPTKNQITNSDKVIKSSGTFLGGKRNGYAYQNFLYEWGAKKIDQTLDLPLGTFKKIQRDIAKQLPQGVSLDEVFGVKSSGRYAPIEGVLTNPLESGANVDKGSYVDNIKSNYHSKLIDAAGNPTEQKAILKEYNTVIEKSKIRHPDVEFPDYKVGQPPNKTIQGFNKLPPEIQKQLLANYEKTGISPVTKKAMNIFDVAKATGSKTFANLDEKTRANLSSMNQRKAEKEFLGALEKAGCGKAAGGRILMFEGGSSATTCARKGIKKFVSDLKSGKGNTELIKDIFKSGSKLLAGTGRLVGGAVNPMELLKLKNLVGPTALGFIGLWEAGEITTDVLNMGKPLNESMASNWLTKSFAAHSEEFEKQRNLLQSGALTTDAQRKYALDVMKYEQAIKEDKRIQGMEATQLIDVGGMGNIDGSPIYSQQEIDKDRKDLNRRVDDLTNSKNFVEGSARTLENKALMAEKEAGEKAKKEWSPFRNILPDSFLENLNIGKGFEDSFEPKVTHGTRTGRAGRTGVVGHKVDYTRPTYQTMKENPLTKEDIKYFTNKARKIGSLSPTENLDSFNYSVDRFKKNNQGVSTKQEVRGPTPLEILQNNNKWRQALYQPGMLGSQEKLATGGLAGLMKKYNDKR